VRHAIGFSGECHIKVNSILFFNRQ